MGARKREDKSAKVLGLLRDAAEAGLPCPTKEEITRLLGSIQFEDAPAQLAVRGLCVIEVYGRNWRVVEIDGKRSAEPAHGGKPYKIFRKPGEHHGRAHD